MDIHPVRNDRDHAKALRQIEKLWGARARTPEADKLEILVTLVDAYEAKHHSADAAATFGEKAAKTVREFIRTATPEEFVALAKKSSPNLFPEAQAKGRSPSKPRKRTGTGGASRKK